MSISPRGYAALISTLIVCAVLTALAFQAGTSAFLARLSVLESEHAARSRSHAYSCAQIALFELSADWGYRPEESGDTVRLSPETSCIIESVIAEGSELAVTVRGVSEGSQTRLEFRLQENLISRPPFLVLSFREI